MSQQPIHLLSSFLDMEQTTQSALVSSSPMNDCICYNNDLLKLIVDHDNHVNEATGRKHREERIHHDNLDLSSHQDNPPMRPLRRQSIDESMMTTDFSAVSSSKPSRRILSHKKLESEKSYFWLSDSSCKSIAPPKHPQRKHSIGSSLEKRKN